MKAGRITYPPNPTESRYVFLSKREWDAFSIHINFDGLLTLDEEARFWQVSKLMWYQEFCTGKSGAHVRLGSNGTCDIRPMTDEDWDKLDEPLTQKMSVDQIIEKYPLTEKQIQALKNYERK